MLFRYITNTREKRERELEFSGGATRKRLRGGLFSGAGPLKNRRTPSHPTTRPRFFGILPYRSLPEIRGNGCCTPISSAIVSLRLRSPPSNEATRNSTLRALVFGDRCCCFENRRELNRDGASLMGNRGVVRRLEFFLRAVRFE